MSPTRHAVLRQSVNFVRFLWLFHAATAGITYRAAEFPRPDYFADRDACGGQNRSASFVCDPALLLSLDTKLRLDTLIEECLRASNQLLDCSSLPGIHVSVAMVPEIDNTGGPVLTEEQKTEAVAMFAEELRTDRWGHYSVCDQNLVLVISAQDKKMAVSTGVAASPVVTDDCIHQLETAVQPSLQRGEFGEVLITSLQTFKDIINGVRDCQAPTTASATPTTTATTTSSTTTTTTTSPTTSTTASTIPTTTTTTSPTTSTTASTSGPAGNVTTDPDTEAVVKEGLGFNAILGFAAGLFLFVVAIGIICWFVCCAAGPKHERYVKESDVEEGSAKVNDDNEKTRIGSYDVNPDGTPRDKHASNGLAVGGKVAEQPQTENQYENLAGEPAVYENGVGAMSAGGARWQEEGGRSSGDGEERRREFTDGGSGPDDSKADGHVTGGEPTIRPQTAVLLHDDSDTEEPPGGGSTSEQTTSARASIQDETGGSLRAPSDGRASYVNEREVAPRSEPSEAGEAPESSDLGEPESAMLSRPREDPESGEGAGRGSLGAGQWEAVDRQFAQEASPPASLLGGDSPEEGEDEDGPRSGGSDGAGAHLRPEDGMDSRGGSEGQTTDEVVSSNMDGGGGGGSDLGSMLNGYAHEDDNDGDGDEGVGATGLMGEVEEISGPRTTTPEVFGAEAGRDSPSVKPVDDIKNKLDTILIAKSQIINSNAPPPVVDQWGSTTSY